MTIISTEDADQSTLLGQTQIPGYLYDATRDLIGRGGMASVYAATQIGLDRKIALKVLSPDLIQDPSFTDRFLREAKILAQLSHPNIVSIHEAGVYGQAHFLSMDYIGAGDLRPRNRAGLPCNEALLICSQIASALAYLHRQGFVHRDIKPANILFRADGSVAVGDFGIAKRLVDPSQLTQTGSVIGTPSYLSPEQIRAEKCDGRADLYSLGVVLFEMLTGQVPFSGQTGSVMKEHLILPIPELPAELKHLQWIVSRLLAKDPDERFQTAEDLIDVLDVQIRASQSKDNSLAATNVPNKERELVQSSRSAFGMPRFDAQREARFQQEYLLYGIPTIRVGIPIGMLAYLSFFVWDFIQVGIDPIVTYSVRSAFTVLLGFFFAFTFTPAFNKRSQSMVCALLILAAVGVAYILSSFPDGMTFGIAGICLTIMIGSSLFAIQFRTSLVFVFVVIAVANVAILLGNNTLPLKFVLINANFPLFHSSVIGVLFCYFMERNLRVRFEQSGTLGVSWIPWMTTKSSPTEHSSDERIFVCYRREEAADVVGRICDRLERAFGHQALLKDVDIIPLGSDYRMFLGQTIKRCSSMIVVIGPTWIEKLAARADSDDPVRAEVELALNLGLKIFPILVWNASMPQSSELPQGIKAMAFLNAAVIRSDPDFNQDMGRLIDQFREVRH